MLSILHEFHFFCFRFAFFSYRKVFLDLRPARVGRSRRGDSLSTTDCEALAGAGLAWPQGSDWLQGPVEEATGDRKPVNCVCLGIVIMRGVVGPSTNSFSHINSLRWIMRRLYAMYDDFPNNSTVKCS